MRRQAESLGISPDAGSPTKHWSCWGGVKGEGWRSGKEGAAAAVEVTAASLVVRTPLSAVTYMLLEAVGDVACRHALS